MRGRFAPSPTGPLHIGNLRTAMVAWLLARSAGSTFVLRFEDLDSATVRDEYYDQQRSDLERLGLDWDEEIRQSDHPDRYAEAIASLVERGLTYPCYCSRREIREAASAPHSEASSGSYPGTCRDLSAAQRDQRESEGRDGALRLLTDHREVAFVDRLRGPTSARVDDIVISRRDGTPAYNLAVVVDDDYQRIEEVVRADDLLLSTPRHLHLGRLLGFADAHYAHVPLVLGPDGSRLAKRDGAVTLEDRLALGESVAELRERLAVSLGLAEIGTRPTMAQLVDDFDPALIPPEPLQLTASELDQHPQ